MPAPIRRNVITRLGARRPKPPYDVAKLQQFGDGLKRSGVHVTVTNWSDAAHVRSELTKAINGASMVFRPSHKLQALARLEELLRGGN